MSEEFTGDSLGFPEADSSGAMWIRSTHVNDSRCVAYDVPRERSAEERTVRQSFPVPELADEQKNVENERMVRYALRQHLVRAKDLVSQLCDACHRMDPMEQAIVGSDLSEELQALWNARGVREEEWAEVLNFLQSALAQEEFERFQDSHCQAIQQVIVDHLGGGTVDSEDVVRIRLILREAGLDPWKGISSLGE